MHFFKWNLHKSTLFGEYKEQLYCLNVFRCFMMNHPSPQRECYKNYDIRKNKVGYMNSPFFFHYSVKMLPFIDIFAKSTLLIHYSFYCWIFIYLFILISSIYFCYMTKIKIGILARGKTC